MLDRSPAPCDTSCMNITETNRRHFTISTFDRVELRDGTRGVVVSYRDDFGAFGCRVLEIVTEDPRAVSNAILPVTSVTLIEKYVGAGAPVEISDDTAARLRAAQEDVNGQRRLF